MKSLLALFTLLAITGATHAAGGRHALILCNQNYSAVGALKTPLAEAAEASKTLATLGFQGNITVVTDASTAKMTEAVDIFTAKLTEADVALFFYGGHAIQAAGENYLLGVDSNPATTSQLAYKALPLGRVLTNLEGSGARLNLLILDCCRDNPLPTRGRNFGSTRGLAPMANAPKGTFIAYAADANQQAWDDHGQIGLYGTVLFEKMKTPGLRLEDIFIQTREEVAKIAIEKYQHQQEPAEYSKVSGAFYFSGAQGGEMKVTSSQSSKAPIVLPQPPAPVPPEEGSQVTRGKHLTARFKKLQLMKSGQVELTFDMSSRPPQNEELYASLSQSSPGFTTTPLAEHYLKVQASLTSDDGSEFRLVSVQGLGFFNVNIGQPQPTWIKHEGVGTNTVTFRFMPVNGRTGPNMMFDFQTTLKIDFVSPGSTLSNSSGMWEVSFSDLSAK
jgi:hypothetical protein